MAHLTVSVEDLLNRLIAVEAKLGGSRAPEVDAVMGAVKKPAMTLNAALERYEELEKPRLRGKNADQLRRWRNPLRLAVANFEKARPSGRKWPR